MRRVIDLLRYKIILIMLLILLVLYGCGAQEDSAKDNHVNEQIDVYEQFSNQFGQEAVVAQGADIRNIVKEYVKEQEQKAEYKSIGAKLEKIDYSIERCNLSRKETDFSGDIIISFTIRYNWYKLDKHFIIVYILDDKNKLNSVFVEMHNFLSFDLHEVLGDNTEQIFLTFDDSGNGYTLEPIKVLMYNPNTKSMNIIFDEVLSGYSFLPYKKVQDFDFYSISFQNKYSLIPSTTGKGLDIEFISEIFEKKEKVLRSGATRFAFDGQMYSPIGDYYDYKGIAKQIYDEKQ